MRIRIDPPPSQGPVFFGLDPTPRYTAVQYPVDQDLYLSKGLRLRLTGTEAVISGGPNLTLTIPMIERPNSSRPDLTATVDSAESTVSARLLGVATEDPELRLVQPIQILYRVDSRCITADMLAEELLAKLKKLKSACRARLLPSEQPGQFFSAQERCAIIRDAVQDGHFDPPLFDSVLNEVRLSEPLLKEAFFLTNLDDRAEGVRGALLRASYHFSRMTYALDQINQRQPLEFVIAESDAGAPIRGELRHVSKLGDAVADEFVSAVLAAYSALDLLRKLLDFLLREPFGDPKRPKESHFMDRLSAELPAYQIELPFAIPNLASTHFQALYLLRSDFVHNVATDYLRAPIYIGVGLEPVNGKLLQYAQYMTRDISQTGAGVSHGWSTRFYKQKRDAQEVLADAVTDVWQTVFDTVDWLIHHVKQQTTASL